MDTGRLSHLLEDVSQSDKVSTIKKNFWFPVSCPTLALLSRFPLLVLLWPLGCLCNGGCQLCGLWFELEWMSHSREPEFSSVFRRSCSKIVGKTCFSCLKDHVFDLDAIKLVIDQFDVILNYISGVTGNRNPAETGIRSVKKPLIILELRSWFGCGILGFGRLVNPKCCHYFGMSLSSTWYCNS